ncbi:Gfo/Idh/MocA family protein [Sphingobacterium arenae]|uniref:Gfo/Idh/MocA family oxidoreductase n=1 Tax=Sphingobacterium arenae TaxID=1280598 RepID=A0ABR7Y666_9SPHI|nr:Gfo/Idh/MocA family oxidoreductase [Sphingobacterium arenae]MBD1426764.1 Gfo/Idh/MocA family oxidoreductase [Sphingobacterium arenae]
METIKWGMIGVGDVTEVKSGPAFYKTPHSILLAVTARTREKVEDYALRHGIPKVYQDVTTLLADPNIDIVYIATPPSTHKEYALQVIRAGKAVYVEKPMAMSYREAKEMYELAKQKGVALFVAFYRRALPYFFQVKQWIDEGKIGRLLTVSVRLIRPPYLSDLDPNTHTWRIKKEIGGEGYFVDMAPHTLDILDYIIGPIAEVRGYANNLAGNYKVSDSVCASWLHNNGVLGNGTWTFSSISEAEQDQIIITGTNGEIRFSTFDFSPIAWITPSGTQFFDFKKPQHIQQPLIESIVKELRGEGYCPSTGESALRTTAVIEKILPTV